MTAFFAALYAFVLAHQAAIISAVLLATPSIITGLSQYPKASGFVSGLRLFLNIFSVLTHSDSPGTLKAPLTVSSPPVVAGSSLRTTGFARLPLLLAMVLVSLIATAAHAQDAHVPGTPTPAASDPIVTYAPLGSGAVFTAGGKLIAQADAPVTPVVAAPPAPIAPPAAPADATPVTPTIGGCFASGKLCVGPSVAITLTAINLTTQRVEAGFSPGVGIGLTYQKGTWNSVGLGAYFNLTPGAGGIPDQAGGALIASFLNGWGRVGVSKGFLGDKSTRLLVGTGLDL